MNSDTHNNSEYGNVLFLILIAVALFAALSYAVTLSNRSSSSSSSESTLISSASLTHYPAQVRSMINKMIFRGLSVSELEFNKPQDFGTCTSPSVCVFHPNGGGAVFAAVAPDIITMGLPNDGWKFTPIFEIVDIGSSTPSSFSGNDIMMYIIGVKQSVCNKLHEKQGISNISSSGFANATMTATNMDTGWIQPASETILGVGATAVLEGHSEGCFLTTDGTNVFYSILFER